MSGCGKRPPAVQRGLLGAFVALLLPVLALAAPIKTQGTWYGSNGLDGTLRGRDAAGNPINLLNAAGDAPNPDLMYVYDTVLDLTWLADWNAGAGSVYDDGPNSTDGKMTWANAKAWAVSLTDFGGAWALPSVADVGPPGCSYSHGTPPYSDCGFNVYGGEVGRRGSPLAHMFYDTLGNEGYLDLSGAYNFWSPVGWGLTNTGPFRSMQPDIYWSGTAYAVAPTANAWMFDYYNGQQQRSVFDPFLVVAVRSGDVGIPGTISWSVPEPRGLVLLGLAFWALAVARRRAHDLTARDDTGGTEP